MQCLNGKGVLYCRDVDIENVLAQLRRLLKIRNPTGIERDNATNPTDIGNEVTVDRSGFVHLCRIVS